MPKKKPNTPIDTLRDGTIKAVFWENAGENGPFLNVTFARTYTKDGDPQDTNTFYGRNLLVLSDLARRAYHKEKELRAELGEENREPA